MIVPRRFFSMENRQQFRRIRSKSARKYRSVLACIGALESVAGVDEADVIIESITIPFQ
jgi:hypothetical protein